MKKRIKYMVPILLVLMAIMGCKAKQVETEEPVDLYENITRPLYQRDQSLHIAMDAELGDSFNPFVDSTKGEEMILSVIFTSPLKENADGELIPWNGNIISGRNADGSISYLVSIDQDLHFTDGTPIDIDDYLYSLYVKADPTYNGPGSLFCEDIRGLESYWYDDEDWEENLGKLYRYAESNYSNRNISQDDYVDYLLSTDIDGCLYSRTPDEWKALLSDDGWTEEIEKARTDEELIELIALYEYAENMDAHDPLPWYREKLEEAYIRKNLADGIQVETISGIEKLNSHVARITLESVNPNTVSVLNTYMVPSHYYGRFSKGNLDEVLSKNIPLGAGAYTFYAEYDDKTVLRSNDSYREGIPNIGSVIFHSMDEESIVSGLKSGTLDIGLLRGRTEYLKDMGNNIRCNLVPQGSYASIFLNSSTLDRNSRMNLYDTIRKVVKYLPLSPTESKVGAPISPGIPEYPKDLPHRRLPEGRTGIEERKDIIILVDKDLRSDNMQKFLKDLHTELNLNGNSLKESYVDRSTIERMMISGEADACIIESTGTLDEKKAMYHSEGDGNIQNIKDPILDEILENLLAEPSLDDRRKLAGMLCSRIDEEGLEVPLYQNRAIIAYNIENIDMESVPEVSTSSWTFLSTIWSLRKR